MYSRGCRMKTLLQRAGSILATNRYMTIATATRGGTPWISPVFFASDGIKRFYWYSPRESRHSRLIAKNPRVAITLFDSRASPEKVDGLYVQAKARVLRPRELLGALPIYGRKMYANTKDRRALLKKAIDFTRRSPLRMYVAIPEKIWLLGPEKHYKDKYLDSREELKGQEV